MKPSTVVSFFVARARYLALALPLFALFSTVQAGCSSSAKGGYYYGYGGTRGTSGGTSGTNPPGEECTSYTVYTGYGGSKTYSNCDDLGGYGNP